MFLTLASPRVVRFGGVANGFRWWMDAREIHRLSEIPAPQAVGVHIRTVLRECLGITEEHIDFCRKTEAPMSSTMVVVVAAGDQIAVPVTRGGPIVGFRRTLANGCGALSPFREVSLLYGDMLA